MNLVFQKGVHDFNVHVHLSLSIYLLSLLNSIVSIFMIFMKVYFPKFIFQSICIVYVQFGNIGSSIQIIQSDLKSKNLGLYPIH
jgi:hypothetical protein